MGDLTVSEVLSKAADLIEPEGAWTQKAASRDRRGNMGPPREQATCWCLFGAISRVAPRRGELEGLAIAAVQRVVGDAFIAWNDAPERTQAEVVAALREASKLATPPNEPSAAMGKGGGE